MSTSVGFIGTFLYICSSAIKAQTIPDAGLVAIGYPLNEELYFPTIGDHCSGNCGDDLCGIRVNIEAKWNKIAPESNGDSTIKLTFEHTNFRENRTVIIKIPHDKNKIKEAIDICLSRCPTLSNELDKSTFTLHAVTDNIQAKNAIDVIVTVEKSARSDCYEIVGLVATDHTWNHKIDLPSSDDFCGIWVNLTAWWRQDRAPELSGTYTIDLKFDHPNFKKQNTAVMKIKIPNDKKETTNDINICFSHCPTRSYEINQSFFTIHAETDNIQNKNPIHLQITTQKSYKIDCYPTVLENVYDMNTPTLICGASVIILLILVFIFFLCKHCRTQADGCLPRRGNPGWRPGGGGSGGDLPRGGPPGWGPSGGDPSGGQYLGVSSDEDPPGGRPPGSGSHTGGPSGWRQIFGGGKTGVEQSRELESDSLTEIDITKGGRNIPRGRKPKDE